MPELHAAPNPPVPATPPTATGGSGHVSCEQCSAPVEHAQRYCVVCGHHRGHVPDPATEYLALASARRRSTGPAAARRAGRRRGGGIAAALVLAIIPVAAAVGVEVGRSQGNDNARLAKLAQELSHPRPVTVVVNQTGGAGTAAASTASKRGKPGRGTRKAASATRSTAYGTVTQAVGAKVTKAAAAAGASEAANVQKSTGSGYINADNNLPTTVVP